MYDARGLRVRRKERTIRRGLNVSRKKIELIQVL
jgi:hypothetical protein